MVGHPKPHIGAFSHQNPTDMQAIWSYWAIVVVIDVIYSPKGYVNYIIYIYIHTYSYVPLLNLMKHVRYVLIRMLFEALPNVHFIFMASYKSNFEIVRVCMGPLIGIHHRVPLWVWIIHRYHQKPSWYFAHQKKCNVLFRHIKIIYWTTCCHDTCAFSGLPITLVMIVKICVFFISISKRKNQPLALL